MSSYLLNQWVDNHNVFFNRKVLFYYVFQKYILLFEINVSSNELHAWNDDNATFR